MKHPPFESPINVASDTTELVRGQEERLIEQLKPLVCEQSVTLNLRNVTRIDAAGLTALIQLYCAAREAGHSFAVVNPSPRVEEILALVGLDRRLMYHNEGKILYPGIKMEETAA